MLLELFVMIVFKGGEKLEKIWYDLKGRGSSCVDILFDIWYLIFDGFLLNNF